MDAGLSLKMTVRIIALNVQRGAADAGFLVAQYIDKIDSVMMPFSPARVHSDEHLGPVAGLGAATAGLNLDERTGCVLRAAEHRTRRELSEPFFDACQFLFEFRFEAGIFVAQFR